ncbi:MAG: aminotransferase, partial [Oscillospiraceae bacterium]|nr:aminotransferase [Oscillospiraceae bacterium]
MSNLDYKAISGQEREAAFAELKREYEEIKALALNLDMTRGKPCPEQLELSAKILKSGEGYDFIDEAGQDTRNYGELTGAKEMRRIFGEILGIDTENIIAAGNSSLNLMYDLISSAYTHGLPHSEKPWCGYER